MDYNQRQRKIEEERRQREIEQQRQQQKQRRESEEAARRQRELDRQRREREEQARREREKRLAREEAERKRQNKEYVDAMHSIYNKNHQPQTLYGQLVKTQVHGKKVICTELRSQGLMSKADYHMCARDARQRLSDLHYRGYHFWALAVVRQMRRSSSATQFWRILAQARADEIAFRMGIRPKRSRLGQALIAFGEPACLVLGKFVSARDWTVLYRPFRRT